MKIKWLLSLFLLSVSCSVQPLRIPLEFHVECSPSTRSVDPDENRISDLNIFIFNEAGLLEEKRFIRNRDLERIGEDAVFRTDLLREGSFSVYLCANLGYAPEINSHEELAAFRYHLTHPDEYSRGMPMSGRLLGLRPSETEGIVRIPLERLMAKVSVSVNRRDLDPGVRLLVRKIRIGGCPSSVRLFGESRAESSEQLFSVGFTKEYAEVEGMNRELADGMSREVSLYLLENLQGRNRSDLCSFIEIEAEYYSDRYYAGPGQYLVYRFYLGSSAGKYDIERNCHYHFSVHPVGEGLSGDGWRVDRSRLGQQPVTTAFDLHPAAYNESWEWAPFHLWCDILPPDTPVEIETLAYDDSESVSNIYDYQIDPDGHGLVLTPKKGGSALVYFKAGPPVNKDTLALVVFNLHR